MLKDKKSKRTYSYFDLFKYNSQRINTIGCCLLYASCQIMYYGTQFSLSTLGLNVYITAAIAPLFEIVSNLVASKINCLYLLIY